MYSEGSKFNAGNGDVPGTALIRIMTVVIIVKMRSHTRLTTCDTVPYARLFNLRILKTNEKS
jgi:hypothetical protein